MRPIEPMDTAVRNACPFKRWLFRTSSLSLMSTATRGARSELEGPTEDATSICASSLLRCLHLWKQHMKQQHNLNKQHLFLVFFSCAPSREATSNWFSSSASRESEPKPSFTTTGTGSVRSRRGFDSDSSAFSGECLAFSGKCGPRSASSLVLQSFLILCGP